LVDSLNDALNGTLNSTEIINLISFAGTELLSLSLKNQTNTAITNSSFNLINNILNLPQSVISSSQQQSGSSTRLA
jgi:hypothetical protein